MRKIMVCALSMSLCLSMSQSFASEKPSAVQQRIDELTLTLQSIQKDITDNKVKLSKRQKALQHIDKKIAEKAIEVKTLEQAMAETNKLEEQLKQQLVILNQQKKEAIKDLESIIAMHFKSDLNHPLKILLKQDNVGEAKTIHVFLQALSKGTQDKIESLQKELKPIMDTQDEIERQQGQKKELQLALTTTLAQLGLEKEKQKDVIKSIHQSISDHNKRQQVALKEKDQLSMMLQSIVQQVPSTAQTKFSSMRGKLPSPLANRGFDGSSVWDADEGTKVQAVFDGRVVFSEWLRGVGLLLIIDHGQGYMSLYGNNQILLKTAGDWVRQGEQIASVGQSGGLSKPGLYFELRKDGEPLDPKSWVQQG